jgi:hypothetical protein
VVNAGGTISLRGNNNLYVSSENGTQAMTCTRTSIQGWEMFTYTVVGNARQTTEVYEEETVSDEDVVSVFPNPSAGNITIHVGQPSRVNVIEVHKGNSVFESDVNESVEVRNLRPGIYAVKLSGVRSRVMKVVVR